MIMAVVLNFQQPVFDPPEVIEKVDISYLEKPFIPITEITMVEKKPKFNHFVKGNCTYWVASKREIPWYGNAGEWLANAQSAGFDTGTVPKEGAIVVTYEGNRLGHVAYVEKVNSDDFTISEMNYQGLGVKSIRTLSFNYKAIKGFIY